jgi:hypothetical protein
MKSNFDDRNCCCNFFRIFSGYLLTDFLLDEGLKFFADLLHRMNVFSLFLNRSGEELIYETEACDTFFEIFITVALRFSNIF